MSGGEVIEGFLCPLCMKDLGDVIQLQVHFDEAHTKEDQAFVQTFKELFGKAKRILADDPDTGVQGLQEPVTRLRLAPSEEDDSHPVSGIRRDLHPVIVPDQLSGTSHMAELKKIRSSRVDRYATETNRLIVRLDKLLTNLPNEAGRRREHEKAVVAWVDEDLVKLCPSCARGFNIARRKHHCRLCGSVMCQDCSEFVDFNLCRRLINPSTLANYKLNDRPGWNLAVSRGQADTRSEAGGRRSSGLFKLRRSRSRESLGSAMISGVMADNRLKDEFRCCGYCKSLLSHRDLLMELASSEPIIAQFYSKLREYIRQGEEMNPQYLAMYDSLMAGESNYHSSDVKTLRVKLLKVAENIDLMSKKIQALGVDNSNQEVQEGMAKPRRFALQDQVRRASINFIKETLVGLPSLPSDEELAKIQERRKMEIARQLEENRRKREEAQAKYQAMQEKRKLEADRTKSSSLPRSGSGGKFNRSKVSYESGFVLSSSAQQREVVTEVTDDPMLQQIQIITGYIAQARQQNRFDEVHMLETNLNMLKEEFNRQRDFQQATPSEQDSSQEPASYVSFQNGDDRPDQNPFKSDDSDDEYDASGKNPFAE